MAMDKITKHIFKRNAYVNKFPRKLSNAYINQLLHIMWGGVRMNIFKKSKKLIPTQLSRKYNNDIAYS